MESLRVEKADADAKKGIAPGTVVAPQETLEGMAPTTNYLNLKKYVKPQPGVIYMEANYVDKGKPYS